MKKKLIILIISLPVFILAGEDNYLFEKKEICMLCLEEIAAKENPPEGTCYSCKGRYGDKPGNKYFIVMNTEKMINEKLYFESKSNDTKKNYFSGQEFVMKKQQGMDEDSIKKLCPDTYHKYKKNDN